MAACAAAAAFSGTAAAQQPAASVIVKDDAVVFEGQINARSAADFLTLVQRPDITRVIITSRGGSVSAALDMAGAIADRQLDVEVPKACFSSCANYIFPAGNRKRIGRLGAVAWHGNMAHVLYLQQHGLANWDEQQLRDARMLARREEEFFGRIGVDGLVCWFGKLEPYNVPDFYYLSVSDMERFGIQHVSVSDDSAEDAGNDEVRAIHVDWAALEAARPGLRLTE